MRQTQPISAKVPVDGNRVREQRIKRGLGIGALATQVGVDRSYINKIELEPRWVSPRVYKELLKALGLRSHSSLLRTGVTREDVAA